MRGKFKGVLVALSTPMNTDSGGKSWMCSPGAPHRSSGQAFVAGYRCGTPNANPDSIGGHN